MDRWLLLKDILLTGTGMAIVLSQVFAHTPSDVLLVTGLALTVPSVAAHAGSLLGAHAAHTGTPSSPSSSSSGSSPSGSSSEAADE